VAGSCVFDVGGVAIFIFVIGVDIVVIVPFVSGGVIFIIGKGEIDAVVDIFDSFSFGFSRFCDKSGVLKNLECPKFFTVLSVSFFS